MLSNSQKRNKEKNQQKQDFEMYADNTKSKMSKNEVKRKSNVNLNLTMDMHMQMHMNEKKISKESARRIISKKSSSSINQNNDCNVEYGRENKYMYNKYERHEGKYNNQNCSEMPSIDNLKRHSKQKTDKKSKKIMKKIFQCVIPWAKGEKMEEVLKKGEMLDTNIYINSNISDESYEEIKGYDDRRYKEKDDRRYKDNSNCYSRVKSHSEITSIKRHEEYDRSHGSTIYHSKSKSMKELKNNDASPTSTDYNNLKDKKFSKYKSKSMAKIEVKREVVYVGAGNGICGIINVLNSCYQNAVFQFLAAIPDIISFIHENDDWDIHGTVLSEFGNFVRDIWTLKYYDLISVHRLHRTLKKINPIWVNKSQEDAHEFLVSLLTTLRNEIKQITSLQSKTLALPDPISSNEIDVTINKAEEEWLKSRIFNRSKLDDLFGFQLHHQLTCPECHNIFDKFEYVTELQLPLAKQHRFATLEDYVLELSLPESLDGENKWLCPNCSVYVCAIKQMRIVRFPKILIVCLQRFTSTMANGIIKDRTPILIPTKGINFEPLLSPKFFLKRKQPVFDLISVIDHYGTADDGHYAARVKNIQDNLWYRMDDMRVSVLSPLSGFSTSPYLFAFRQKRYYHHHHHHHSE